VTEYDELRDDFQSRLDRVNEILSRWDEYETSQNLPEDVRPRASRPPLSRESLEEMNRSLEISTEGMEKLRDRRN
jgi:hypothetical protein